MTKTIYSSLAILLLSACSSEPIQKKEKSPLEQKVDIVKEAKTTVASVNETIDTTEKIVEDTVEKTVESVEKEIPSTASLYLSSCSSCHGKSAEKPALNASAIIATWSSKKIQDALQGYKSGTYGGKMKGIMQGQIKPLSDSQIEALGDYISKL